MSAVKCEVINIHHLLVTMLSIENVWEKVYVTLGLMISGVKIFKGDTKERNYLNILIDRELTVIN